VRPGQLQHRLRVLQVIGLQPVTEVKRHPDVAVSRLAGQADRVLHPRQVEVHVRIQSHTHTRLLGHLGDLVDDRDRPLVTLW